MAAALVGSVGAVSTGAAGAAVTPAWGTGESRTAGNLLVCWVGGENNVTLPTTPSGWSVLVQVQASTEASATILYRIATGADTAPTIAGSGTQIWSVQLAEFSGCAPASPLDQSGTATGTSGTNTATCGAADGAAGELVLYGSVAHYSASATVALADNLNNGATANSTTNGSSSTNRHYSFGWGITTGHSSADSDSFTFTTTNVLSSATVIASVKPLTAYSGSGSLSGSGTLAGTGTTNSLLGRGSFAGSGALGGSATVDLLGTASLTALGHLAGSGAYSVVPGTGAFAGLGKLVGAGSSSGAPSLSFVTVTGTVTDPNDIPATGTVTFTLSTELTNGKIIVPPVPVQAVITNGTLTNAAGAPVVLAATNDPATAPPGAYYSVTLAVAGALPYTAQSVMPYSVGTIDLSTLLGGAVAGASGSFSAQGVLSGRGYAATLGGGEFKASGHLKTKKPKVTPTPGVGRFRGLGTIAATGTIRIRGTGSLVGTGKLAGYSSSALSTTWYDTTPTDAQYVAGVASALHLPAPPSAGFFCSSGWSANDIATYLPVNTPYLRVATAATQTTWQILDFEQSFVWSYSQCASWIKARLALGSYSVMRPTVYVWYGNWLSGGPDGHGLKAGLAAYGLTQGVDFDLWFADQTGTSTTYVAPAVAMQWYGANQSPGNGVPSGAYVDVSTIYDSTWLTAMNAFVQLS